MNIFQFMIIIKSLVNFFLFYYRKPISEMTVIEKQCLTDQIEKDNKFVIRYKSNILKKVSKSYLRKKFHYFLSNVNNNVDLF